METERKVIEILAEQACIRPKDVRLDASLEELGIDSLRFVEAVFAIEETFDIQIPFNANAPEEGDFDISTVAAVIEGLKALLKEKA